MFLLMAYCDKIPPGLAPRQDRRCLTIKLWSLSSFPIFSSHGASSFHFIADFDPH